MIVTKPCIIYSLPHSRVTQALLGGKIEVVWEKLKFFLANCTNANVNFPASVNLTVISANEDYNESSDFINCLLHEIIDLFGAGSKSPIGYHYPSNTPTKQTKTEWELTYRDLTEVLNYMIKKEPWPKYQLEPAQLFLMYDFKLTEPSSKIELSNQPHTSNVAIWLSRTKSISPTLWFPFDEANDAFWTYIDSIESFLPFKLEKKQFRLVRPNKKGTANIFSKL